MDKELMERLVIRSCSDEELERRWDITAKAMEEHDIDYIVAAQRTDYLGCYVKWLTDLPTQNEYGAIAIFSRDKELETIWHGPIATGVMPPAHCSRGIATRWSVPQLPSLNYTNIYDAEIIVKQLAPKGAIRIGLVGQAFMTVHCYKYLQEHLTQAVFVDFDDVIDELKAAKSDEEIVLIREMSTQQDEVMEHIAGYIEPGRREIDVYAELRYQAHKRGAENGIFLVGSNSRGKAAPMYNEHFHSNRVIEKGDTVTIVLESNAHNGMYGHVAGVFSLGEPSDELVEAMDWATKANDYHLSLLKPGADCRELYRLHNEFMRAHGLAEETRLLSHSQGYDLVERPAIVPGETIKIQANMNISPHPSVPTEKAFGIVCANYIVKETGVPECIHSFPQKIHVL